MFGLNEVHSGHETRQCKVYGSAEKLVQLTGGELILAKETKYRQRAQLLCPFL